ncbi:hypothetical protein [Nocardia asteroides]|uniref:hypothetical protein n=1 Tax=Nocardia asteroides TaxID=1824 RepID=UPI00365B84C1
MVVSADRIRAPDPHSGRRLAYRRGVEQRWAAAVGERGFAAMCATMQRLLDQLDPAESRR